MKEIVLNQEIIDQMIFAVENQNSTPFFDTEEGVLLYLENNPDTDFEGNPDRYWPLPEWKPANGFQLMKQFVGQLNNPVYQKKLADALQSGKGVFRKFKDIIKESREMEKKWLLFKEKEMEKVILEWFELFSSSKIYDTSEDIPEETSDLILSDFTIEIGNEERWELFRQWDSDAWNEIFQDKTRDEKEFYINRIRPNGEMNQEKGSVVVAALEPEGGPVGFIWCRLFHFGNNRSTAWIQQLYVLPEFRGIGIGKLLTEEAIRFLKGKNIIRIETILPSGRDFMEKFFKSLNISPSTLWLSGEIS